jgi:putative endonuclease
VTDGWELYLVRDADGRLYTGISTDPERRLREHDGTRRGARALRGRGPLALVFRHPAGDRAAALRLEAAVKRLDRRAKERLVSGETEAAALLAETVS